MGYMLVLGPCLVCRHTFSYNPAHVPSLRGKPICQDCMDEANRIRAEQGKHPHRIHPEAYEALSDGL
jgi:hypothetical protein